MDYWQRVSICGRYSLSHDTVALNRKLMAGNLSSELPTPLLQEYNHEGNTFPVGRFGCMVRDECVGASTLRRHHLTERNLCEFALPGKAQADQRDFDNLRSVEGQCNTSGREPDFIRESEFREHNEIVHLRICSKTSPEKRDKFLCSFAVFGVVNKPFQ
jgi:hypothetical protein